MATAAPSLGELQAFIEVASCGSITQAAQRLGCTQSALSQGMQRLEANLGTTLLVRGTRGVTLTAAVSGSCAMVRPSASTGDAPAMWYSPPHWRSPEVTFWAATQPSPATP